MKLPKYTVAKIGSLMKKKRLSLELTREELAVSAKVNYNTIIKIESGANKNPTIQTLIGIAKVLKMRVEDFIL